MGICWHGVFLFASSMIPLMGVLVLLFLSTLSSVTAHQFPYVLPFPIPIFFATWIPIRIYLTDIKEVCSCISVSEYLDFNRLLFGYHGVNSSSYLASVMTINT